MKKIQLKLFAAMLTLFAGCAAVQVNHVTNPSLSTRKQGFVYNLPKAQLKVVVTYKKIVAEEGKWKEYSGLVPEYSMVVKKPGTKYLLTKVEITSQAIRDETQNYFVAFRGKNNPLLSQNSSFKITKNGFLTTSNIEFEDKTIPFLLEAGETILELAGDFVELIPFSTPTTEVSSFFAFDASNASKPEKERHEQIDIVINELKLLRTKRVSLLCSPMDGEDEKNELAGRIAELKAQEERLSALFVGKIKVKEYKKTVIIPPVSGTNSYNLFPFSTDKGPDQAGAPWVTLNLVSVDNDSLTSFSGTRDTTVRGKKGIFYRIPADVSATIEHSGKTYAHFNLLIPQMGTQTFLPARLGLFKNKIVSGLDPGTGSLIQLDMNSESLDSTGRADIQKLLERLLEEEDEEDQEEQEESDEAIEDEIQSLLKGN